jgi:MFS family permease
MFRALAEYAMRGRRQAIIAAAILTSLPLVSWIGSSVAALVVLSKGTKEGILVALWASLPLILGYAIAQDVSGFLALLGVLASALILRATTSWELVLYAATALAVVQSGLFALLSGSILDSFVSLYLGMLSSVPELEAAIPDEASARWVAVAFLAMGQGYLIVLTLMLARWMQSALYRPGAFGQELQQLKLSKPVVLLLVVGLLGLTMSPSGGAWIGVVSLPLVIGGACVTHALLNERGAGHHWYVAFYVSLVLFAQVAITVMALVMAADTLFDLRRKKTV